MVSLPCTLNISIFINLYYNWRMTTLSPLLMLVAGLVLLFAGRKVFWLAAALTAFLFTYNLTLRFLGTESLVGLIIAALVGLILAGLAIRFVKLVGVIIGGLSGAVGLPLLLHLFGVSTSSWVFIVIGAILGIFVVLSAFEIGLIVMTAWIGATVVSGSALLTALKGAMVRPVIFIVLLLAGILVQFSQWGRGRG